MVTQELAAQGNLLNVKMPALAQANAALSAAHAWARAAAQAASPANTRAPYSKRATLTQVRPIQTLSPDRLLIPYLVHATISR